MSFSDEALHEAYALGFSKWQTVIRRGGDFYDVVGLLNLIGEMAWAIDMKGNVSNSDRELLKFSAERLSLHARPTENPYLPTLMPSELVPALTRWEQEHTLSMRAREQRLRLIAMLSAPSGD